MAQRRHVAPAHDLLAHDIVEPLGPGPGLGQTVVLLHSTICDRTMWDPQVHTLAEAGFRVLRCDFRGYGRSPIARHAHDCTDDVRDLVDAVGARRISIVGASFGGEVGQDFAARWPNRVTQLALLGSGARGHPTTPALIDLVNRQARLAADGKLEEQIELNLALYLGPAADEQVKNRVAQMYRNILHLRQTGTPWIRSATPDIDLTAITAPTLVATGAYDVDYFQQIAHLIVAAIPRAQLLSLPWAGHLPSLEDPDQLNPHLLGFLTAGSWSPP